MSHKHIANERDTAIERTPQRKRDPARYVYIIDIEMLAHTDILPARERETDCQRVEMTVREREPE